MASDRAAEDRLPFVLVEVDQEEQEAAGTRLRRWAIVDADGEIVSSTVTFVIASNACAALNWWCTAPTREVDPTPPSA